MDHNSTSSFVVKFAKIVPIFLKFVWVDEILGFVSISGELYQPKVDERCPYVLIENRIGPEELEKS